MSVRRRWERLDWACEIPPAAWVIPEAHYMEMDGLGLSDRQRAVLNRLFACFTCELFIHFEGYVIRYLEARRVPFLSQAVVARFVAEERVHSDMFQRLLNKLRPDLYAVEGAFAPRFLRWSRGDDVALLLAPVGTFFLLAWLFEEITLFVPRALDAVPEQTAPLVAEVMRLHAREEQPHVAIDARVLSHLERERPRWRTRMETLMTLPMLVFVDGRVGDAWRRLVAFAGAELDLTETQRARIAGRGPSQSDRWGMESFAAKIGDTDLGGASTLRWVLRRELLRSAP